MVATLSINTSITSAHKDYLYSTYYNDGTYNWCAIIDAYGNWFDSGNSTPCETMMWYLRIQDGTWYHPTPLECNLCGYYNYAYCRASMLLVMNPQNIFYDKVRINYGGLQVESFINIIRGLNVHVTDTLNNPIQNATVNVTCLSTPYMTWSDVSSLTDANGNTQLSFFNPPRIPWDYTQYRTYRITATKTGMQTITQDHIIPNTDYYPTYSTSVEMKMQASCNTISCSFNVT